MATPIIWISPDESFDAVISNYVYHNIMGADMHKLLLESLRVLKKGGVFALNDDMKPKLYGDMDVFAQNCGRWAIRTSGSLIPQKKLSAPTAGLP